MSESCTHPSTDNGQSYKGIFGHCHQMHNSTTSSKLERNGLLVRCYGRRGCLTDQDVAAEIITARLPAGVTSYGFCNGATAGTACQPVLRSRSFSVAV